ncbi:hypothetical protein HDU99_007497 [Rhizoclosmatium hyalinum]|nr:hypothetical protein HDU99_007497 [Rhizoclosmatium hyalinum]
MIGSSPTTSLVQTSCIKPKATRDRMLSAPAPFSDAVNETEGKDTRIMELENDVSLLLEQLLALKEKNLEMDAKLASKEEDVGSADEKD